MHGNYKLIFDKVITLYSSYQRMLSALPLPLLAPWAVGTKNEGAYISASVAFKGACVGVFVEGTGQLGDNYVKSAAGEVRHKDCSPH